MLKAGTSSIKITPEIGTLLGGYSPPRASEGTLDDIYAKALLLDDSDTPYAVITADLLGIPAAVISKIRSEIKEKTSIPEENIFISCSHTHSAPFISRAERPEELEYIDTLPGLFSSCASSALKNLKEVRIGYSEGNLKGFVYNRRKKMPEGDVCMMWDLQGNYIKEHYALKGINSENINGLNREADGPVDEKVRIIRFDGTDGNLFSLLVNFSCHNVTLGRENKLVSADYAGVMMKLVEEKIGHMVQFTNGTSGNVNPVYRNNEGRLKTGEALATEVLRIYGSIKTAPSECPIKKAIRRVKIPVKKLPSPDEAQRALEEKKVAVSSLEKSGIKDYRLGNAKWEAIFADWIVRFSRDFYGKAEFDAEVYALNINGIILLGLPGEVFVEVGNRIRKEAKVKNLIIAAPTNDYIGYICHSESYNEGGYEPVWNKMEEGTGERVVSVALDAVKSAI